MVNLKDKELNKKLRKLEKQKMPEKEKIREESYELSMKEKAFEKKFFRRKKKK